MQNPTFASKMTYSFLDMMLSAALAVFVAVSVVVAFVRWGHRCEPYAQNMDYYFPAWKGVIFCYLVDLVLAPGIFMPTDPDAMLQLRIMLVVASPYFCAMLLFAYFGKVLNVTWWKRPIVALSVPFAMVTLTTLVTTLIPGTQMTGDFLYGVLLFTGILTLACIACFVMAVRMIARAMRHVSEEYYSNPDDFPQAFASRIIWIPMLHVGTSWISAFIGTQLSLIIGLLVLTMLNTLFVVSFLKPHRALDENALEGESLDFLAEDKAGAAAYENLSAEWKDEIIQLIRQKVEREKAYLDSHLSLKTLSQACNMNRTYVSQVLSEQFGGFFTYVNQCRLAHAEAYKVSHPKADVDEVALASGFNSRQSYYNARNRLN